MHKLGTWLGIATGLVAAGCGLHHGSYVDTTAALGRVVIYRNGVAFYERKARVADGRLRVKVPRERVDDFLKSLTISDQHSGQRLSVTIPRHEDENGEFLDMELETPERRAADVVMTYVTEAPAWKPSYRITVNPGNTVALEGWAVVDNTSGEDWKDVLVGVGSSSAMSFRYDLWSIRSIARQQLAGDASFAVAPPTGMSPYGGDGAATSIATPIATIDGLDLDAAGGAIGFAFSGSSSIGSAYTGSDAATAGMIQGVVRDETGAPLPGVTIVVTSPALQGSQALISDDAGGYQLGHLAPGSYEVSLYYANLSQTRKNVQVASGKATPLLSKVDTSATAGENISIEASVPAIDAGSTVSGVTLDAEYSRNIPLPGRTFAGELGSAAGMQGDRDAPPAPTPGQIRDAKIQAAVAQLRGTTGRVLVTAAGVSDRDPSALARAGVVRNQLVDAGIAADRIATTAVAASGEDVAIALAPADAAGGQAAAAAAAPPAPATSDDTPVGESHFAAAQPMTVGAGASAMVSILRQDTAGGVVYLFDPLSERGDDRYAFRAVRLDNPTADTLEPGPVTVYGSDRFIGEGLTEPIPPHARAVVPFALDREVVVEHSFALADRIGHLESVGHGQLTAALQHIRTVTYTLTSRLAEPTTVFVRHRVGAGWTLVDAPDGATRSGDAQLFPVALPAGEHAVLTLTEVTPIERSLTLDTPEAIELLRRYAEAAAPGEGPPAALRAQLTAILATYRTLGAERAKIDTIHEQLASYRERQGELHAQVLTLRAVKSGGALMKALDAKLVDIAGRVQRATLDLVDAQERVLVERTELQSQLAELELAPPAAVASVDESR